MIKVKVFFQYPLRKEVGLSEVYMELRSNSTLKDLTERLKEEFGAGAIGESQQYQWRHSGNYIIVSLNKKIIFPNDFPETKLHGGDLIEFFSPIAGG